MRRCLLFLLSLILYAYAGLSSSGTTTVPTAGYSTLLTLRGPFTITYTVQPTDYSTYIDVLLLNDTSYSMAYYTNYPPYYEGGSSLYTTYASVYNYYASDDQYYYLIVRSTDPSTSVEVKYDIETSYTNSALAGFAIALIVIGSICCCAFVVMAIYFLNRRRRFRFAGSHHTHHVSHPPTQTVTTITQVPTQYPPQQTYVVQQPYTTAPAYGTLQTGYPPAYPAQNTAYPPQYPAQYPPPQNPGYPQPYPTAYPPQNPEQYPPPQNPGFQQQPVAYSSPYPVQQ